MSTVIGVRRTVKDAILAVLARKAPSAGRERHWAVEAARSEIGHLTEAIKAEAVELAIVRGKAGWG